MNAFASPWQAALEEAWAAYCEHSLPIGACVADASGTVLARGRNRLGERRSVAGVIGGHDLAHAEINALLALESVPRPDCRTWTVYTTVEPCPQCAGAVTMSGIRGLSFAAPDPWAGCAELLTTHPYMVGKGMQVRRAPADVVRVSLILMVHALLEEEQPDICAQPVAAQAAALEPVVTQPAARIEPAPLADEPLFAEPAYEPRKPRGGFLSIFGGRPRYDQGPAPVAQAARPAPAPVRGGAQPLEAQAPSEDTDHHEDLEIPSFLRRLAN